MLYAKIKTGSLVNRFLAAAALLAAAVPAANAASLTIEAHSGTGAYWQRPAIYHSEDDGTGLANTGELEYYAQGVVADVTGMYTLSVTVDYAATLFVYGGAFSPDAPLNNLLAGYDLYPANTTLLFQGEMLASQPYFVVFSGFLSDGTFGPNAGSFSVSFDGPGTVSLASVPVPGALVLLGSALAGALGLRRRRAAVV